MRLVGPDGSTQVAADDDGGAAVVEWTPTAAATYYVLVSGHAGEVGGYTLRALRDDHGNSAQTATLLTLSGVAAGAVEEPGDVDWFRFSAVAGRTYEFTSSPDELADVALRLYAANGVTVVNAKAERTTILRADIATVRESPVSLMPEGLLKDLRPLELRDLFAYLQGPPPAGPR